MKPTWFTSPGFDQWLFYVKGGGGWIQASATINTPFATFNESRTISGWIGGGGIEWAFAPDCDFSQNASSSDCQHLDHDGVFLAQKGLDRARPEGQMGDCLLKIARSWVRILRAGAVRRLTIAALLATGSSALAQENRGTEEQRVACTPDVLRLCSWEIPNVDRIVACLRRERSKLSTGCRQVLKIEATSRAALNNGAESRHAPRHHIARHRSPGDYERSDTHD